MQRQQQHFGKIMQASSKQFEAEYALRDMQVTLREATDSVSEHMRTADRLTLSIQELQAKNRREAGQVDALTRISEMLNHVRAPPLTERGTLAEHEDLLRSREAIGVGNVKGSFGKKPEIPTRFVFSEAIGSSLSEQLGGPTAPGCAICNKQVLPSRKAFHRKHCMSRQKQRASHTQDCTVPQPPRSLAVVGSPTSETLTLEWQPPIFDGGNPIWEYEIRMNICERTRVGKRTTRHIRPYPPRRVARWCFAAASDNGPGPVPVSTILRNLPPQPNSLISLSLEKMSVDFLPSLHLDSQWA